MVRSIDDVPPDATMAAEAPHPTPRFPHGSDRSEPRADQYAEAELKLRQERTERFIRKATGELP